MVKRWIERANGIRIKTKKKAVVGEISLRQAESTFITLTVLDFISEHLLL